MQKIYKKNKGFTLIELMVVVTIIALLTVAGMAVFTNSRKKAVDARIRTDLKAIQAAMEQNYVEATGYLAIDDVITEVDNFGSAIPLNPLNNNNTYETECSGDADSYLCEATLTDGTKFIVKNLQ